jgi:ABC-type transport system substrate-binding protein
VIAPQALVIQATVISKMLEQVGLTVDLQLLEPAAYNRRVQLGHLEHPPEQQTWDIALTSFFDHANFPPFHFHHFFALDGPWDWVTEQPELRRLYDQVLRTVDREQQEALIHQMEQHTYDQAYFLFLYNPIGLYAVNKAVEFVPYVATTFNLTEIMLTEHHWSLRKRKAAMYE